MTSVRSAHRGFVFSNELAGTGRVHFYQAVDHVLPTPQLGDTHDHLPHLPLLKLPTELEDQVIDLLWLFGADQMACVQHLDPNVWNVLDECRGFGRIAHQIVPFPKHHQHGNPNPLSLFGLER